MKKYLKIIIFIFILIFSFTEVNAEDIDLIVSPIKYEIEANPGATIVKEATIYNKNENTAYVTSFSANFYANDTSGAPSFAKDGSVPNENTELASWITINTSSFSVESETERTISFTINVPQDATPGGHYGAVFFKYDETQTEGLNINADYGVLLLVNVSGEIIDNGNQGNITISGGVGDIEDIKDDENVTVGGNKKDDCVVDLTKSDTDGKCVDEKEATDYVKDIIGKDEEKDKNLDSAKDENNENNNENNDDSSNKNDNEKNEKDFKKDNEFIFNIPFDNKGNTHIKPNGKIILKDENGKNIKSIGKEYVKDKDGNIIGEKIVDHININEGKGNVLPNTKRIFTPSWKGFYKYKDKDGNMTIEKISPEDYFSDLYSTKRTDLYPWERVCQKQETKKIKAFIKTKYKKYNKEEVEFNSAKDLDIVYTKKYIGINPYFFILLILSFLLLLFFFFIIFGKKKKKCKKCKKKIKKDMEICPYCGKKQKEENKKIKK